MIGLANFQRQWDSSRDAYLAAVDRVGRSGWLILGKEVSQFEADLAKFWGVEHAVGVASGLDALEIAFRCLGMKAGDRVLTTPMSAFATTLAIIKVGAVPVFADLDASGQLDLVQARAVVKAAPAKVRFVVPVHLYGHAMDLDALETFAKEEGLTVIEDCAQAIGAKSRGRPVGALSRAFATSFYPTKNLGAFGDGGALLTNDPAVRDLARSLRDYGQSDKYVHAHLGLNSRLDELQAALLSIQLSLLPAQTQRRLAIAGRYREGLAHSAIRVLPVPPGSQSVWHLFPVEVEPPLRKSFQRHLTESSVGSAVHYPTLIPHQPAMASTAWEPKAAGFARAVQLAGSEVSLPMHPFLTDAEVEQVIDACNRWEAKP